jgi:hypothetical protein
LAINRVEGGLYVYEGDIQGLLKFSMKGSKETQSENGIHC